MKISRKSKINELIEFDKNMADNYPLIGLDEAGRGPVAGPVTASAVYFPGFDKDIIEAISYLDDSKKFSSNIKLRKELSDEIKRVAKYSIKECSAREIEKYNILKASLLAMKRAFEDLMSQINLEKPPVLLIDGKFKIPELKYSQKAVVKGDSKSASIAAASILAKVDRDELMINLSKEFPYYGWDKNKGYPTKVHIEAIEEHGLCDWHRKTFIIKSVQKTLF